MEINVGSFKKYIGSVAESVINPIVNGINNLSNRYFVQPYLRKELYRLKKQYGDDKKKFVDSVENFAKEIVETNNGLYGHLMEESTRIATTGGNPKDLEILPEAMTRIQNAIKSEQTVLENQVPAVQRKMLELLNKNYSPLIKDVIEDIGDFGNRWFSIPQVNLSGGYTPKNPYVLSNRCKEILKEFETEGVPVEA